MASSPWGALTVSDAHVHFFSHRFFTLLSSNPEVLGWQLPDEDPVHLANTWVQELDMHGVSRAVLIASAPPDVPSVAAALHAHPDRFHGFAMYDPIHQENVEKVIDQGIRGICLFPALHRYPLHEPRVLETIGHCAKKAVVFVHCGMLSIGVRKKLGLPGVYDPRYSNPLDLESIAHAHPDVRFVIPHFGAGMFREALMVASQCPNVFLDTSSSNSWMKIEGLDLRTVFRRALDVLGPQRLLFGTDSSFFPRGWHHAVYEAQTTALYELGISKDDAKMIFSANLERILDFS